MKIAELKVNNRKKYLDGWDIVAVVNVLGLDCSFEGIIKSDEGKFECWKFYDKKNNKPIKDNETMLKVKDTIQKFFPKSQLQGYTAVSQYAPEQVRKYLGIKVK
ncbi:hypothetical protein [uncultured Megamonas sp.]|uniref:hypothetical protein n=1 Tax=uncultured Megamonas sp. TaxID=286140 RepID=UPI00259B62B3|nr:hypothetical protein [uncultured Megamonas sp.]